MANSSLLGSYGDNIGSSMMFRNKIINGNFDIWQRGTSQTTDGYGSDDRWFNGHVGSTKTSSRQSFTVGQTDVPGNPQYFSRTVVSSVGGPGNLCLKSQPIEFVSTLSGQQVTFSFWAKADASKNIAVEFLQYFGTGGSPSSTITGISVTTCSLTTAWKKFTINVTIPSISGKVLGSNNNDYLAVNFWFEAGSNFNSRTNSLGQQSGTFDIAQVQLEAGPVATPFEQRPIGMELSLCQRYYYRFVTSGTHVFIDTVVATGTYPLANIFYPATMRIAPTSSALIGSAGLNGCTALALATPNPYCAVLNVTSNTGTSGRLYAQFTAGNGFEVSAEL